MCFVFFIVYLNSTTVSMTIKRVEDKRQWKQWFQLLGKSLVDHSIAWTPDQNSSSCHLSTILCFVFYFTCDIMFESDLCTVHSVMYVYPHSYTTSTCCDLATLVSTQTCSLTSSTRTCSRHPMVYVAVYHDEWVWHMVMCTVVPIRVCSSHSDLSPLLLALQPVYMTSRTLENATY